MANSGGNNYYKTSVLHTDLIFWG